MYHILTLVNFSVNKKVKPRAIIPRLGVLPENQTLLSAVIACTKSIYETVWNNTKQRTFFTTMLIVKSFGIAAGIQYMNIHWRTVFLTSVRPQNQNTQLSPFCLRHLNSFFKGRCGKTTQMMDAKAVHAIQSFQ